MSRILRPGRIGPKRGLLIGPQAQQAMAARKIKLASESDGTKRGIRKILRRRRLLRGLKNPKD